MAVCMSCGRNAYDFVKFPCPGAECKQEHVRCKNCRENDTQYACAQCSFEGP